MLWLIFCSCRCDWLMNSGPLSQPVLDGSRTTPSCEFFLSSPLRLLESPSYFSRVLIDRCIHCGFTSCTLKLVYCQQERVILMVDSANGSTYPWVMSLTGRWTVVKRVRCWLVRQRITQATKVWSASIMPNWKIKKGPLKLIIKTSRVLPHWRSIKWNGANNNNIFISYIKYTNITPPANSKANRGRWCVDGLRFITKSWSEKVHIYNKKGQSREKLRYIEIRSCR